MINTVEPDAFPAGHQEPSPEQRDLLSQSRVRYSFSTPLDHTYAADLRGEVPGQETWQAEIGYDEDTVAEVCLFRIPIANGLDIPWECETGEDVPGDPVAAVLRMDRPKAGVIARLAVDDDDIGLGDAFLLLDRLDVAPSWRNLGLESLVLSTVLARVRDRDDLFVVARPVPPHITKRVERAAIAARSKPVLAKLGFKPYAAGVWLLTEWVHLGDSLAADRRRLGLPPQWGSAEALDLPPD